MQEVLRVALKMEGGNNRISRDDIELNLKFQEEDETNRQILRGDYDDVNKSNRPDKDSGSGDHCKSDIARTRASEVSLSSTIDSITNDYSTKNASYKDSSQTCVEVFDVGNLTGTTAPKIALKLDTKGHNVYNGHNEGSLHFDEGIPKICGNEELRAREPLLNQGQSLGKGKCEYDRVDEETDAQDRAGKPKVHTESRKERCKEIDNSTVGRIGATEAADQAQCSVRTIVQLNSSGFECTVVKFADGSFRYIKEEPKIDDEDSFYCRNPQKDRNDKDFDEQDINSADAIYGLKQQPGDVTEPGGVSNTVVHKQEETTCSSHISAESDVPRTGPVRVERVICSPSIVSRKTPRVANRDYVVCGSHHSKSDYDSDGWQLDTGMEEKDHFHSHAHEDEFKKELTLDESSMFFRCPTCGELMNGSEQTKHVCTSTGKFRGCSTEPIPEANGDLSEMKCPECGVGFQNGEDLKMHIEIHMVLAKNMKKVEESQAQLTSLIREPNSATKRPDLEKGSKCLVCFEAFTDPTMIPYHSIMHKQYPFHCRICNLFFSTLRDLQQMHCDSRKRHKVFKYRCKKCTRVILDSRKMLKHRLKCGGETEICGRCKKKFRTFIELEHHAEHCCVEDVPNSSRPQKRDREQLEESLAILGPGEVTRMSEEVHNLSELKSCMSQVPNSSHGILKQGVKWPCPVQSSKPDPSVQVLVPKCKQKCADLHTDCQNTSTKKITAFLKESECEGCPPDHLAEQILTHSADESHSQLNMDEPLTKKSKKQQIKMCPTCGKAFWNHDKLQKHKIKCEAEMKSEQFCKHPSTAKLMKEKVCEQSQIKPDAAALNPTSATANPVSEDDLILLSAPQMPKVMRMESVHDCSMKEPLGKKILPLASQHPNTDPTHNYQVPREEKAKLTQVLINVPSSCGSQSCSKITDPGNFALSDKTNETDLVGLNQLVDDSSNKCTAPGTPHQQENDKSFTKSMSHDLSSLHPDLCSIIDVSKCQPGTSNGATALSMSNKMECTSHTSPTTQAAIQPNVESHAILTQDDAGECRLSSEDGVLPAGHGGTSQEQSGVTGFVGECSPPEGRQQLEVMSSVCCVPGTGSLSLETPSGNRRVLQECKSGSEMKDSRHRKKSDCTANYTQCEDEANDQKMHTFNSKHQGSWHIDPVGCWEQREEDIQKVSACNKCDISATELCRKELGGTMRCFQDIQSLGSANSSSTVHSVQTDRIPPPMSEMMEAATYGDGHTSQEGTGSHHCCVYCAGEFNCRSELWEHAKLCRDKHFSVIVKHVVSNPELPIVNTPMDWSLPQSVPFTVLPHRAPWRIRRVTKEIGIDLSRVTHVHRSQTPVSPVRKEIGIDLSRVKAAVSTKHLTAYPRTVSPRFKHKKKKHKASRFGLSRKRSDHSMRKKSDHAHVICEICNRTFHSIHKFEKHKLSHVSKRTHKRLKVQVKKLNLKSIEDGISVST